MRMVFLATNQKLTKEQRVDAFWSKVLKKDMQECWPWLAGQNQKNYALFWTGKRTEHAHRFSLELSLGRRLRKGEHALHKCDNPSCVNPNHLFVGTNMDNIQDKVKKGRQRGGAGANAAKGERHPKAKLKNADIFQIRKMIMEGKTPSEISRLYSVTIALICMIRDRKIWRHLP